MSEEIKPPEKVISPAREALDLRMKRLEIIAKIEDTRTKRVLDILEIEREKLELEQIKRKEGGWNHPIDKLLAVAQLWYIDNDRSVGTEPALRSFWDEEEIRLIKKQIIKKVREL